MGAVEETASAIGFLREGGIVRNVQNHQKSRQVSSEDLRKSAENHLQASARQNPFGQGISNRFRKITNPKSTVIYVAPVIAIIAFALALKAFHMQRNTTKAVSEHIRDQDNAGQNNP